MSTPDEPTPDETPEQTPDPAREPSPETGPEAMPAAAAEGTAQPIREPHSTSPAPRGPQASVAWAAAVIVVALVLGFLGYTWMTRDDGAAPSADPPAASAGQETEDGAADDTDGSTDGSTDDDSDAGAAGDETSGDENTGSDPPEDSGQATPEPTANQLTPEQEEFLLGLQRRDAADPMAIGAVDAPVVIIEYADYRCPFCSRWSREVKPDLMPLIDDGTVRLEYRDVILFGEESENAALGARAAGEQGLYWEFHDAVAQSAPDSGHPDMPRERVLELAEQVGVPDLDQFEADLDSADLRAAMAADQQEAASIGVRSTPTFLVNTTPVVGAQPIEVFEQLVAQETAD